MIRLAKHKTLVAATLVAAASLASAQEDEQLPDEPVANDQDLQGATDDAAPSDGQAAAPVKAAKGKAAKADKDGEGDAGALWENYDKEAAASVAQQVTHGVHVEDIVEPPSDFRYAAFGKADPFVPPLVATLMGTREGPDADPLEIPIVSPLQRFALGELNVVGVWELASGERKAMIMAANGDKAAQGIIVKGGDPIGNRGGKVLTIGSDFLTVREFHLEPDGSRQYDDQQLFMTGHAPAPVSGKILFTPGQTETQTILDRPEGASRPVGKDARAPTGGGVTILKDAAPVWGDDVQRGPAAQEGAPKPPQTQNGVTAAMGAAPQEPVAAGGLTTPMDAVAPAAPTGAQPPAQPGAATQPNGAVLQPTTNGPTTPAPGTQPGATPGTQPAAQPATPAG